MEESNRHYDRQQWRLRCTGEVVEVPGGHIVPATRRKDRHSKVYTARGLRDRRVRLSAHTAIQFYDVQDRLGYDRPSKAVDWLIQNAKAAIDQLEELPGGHAPADQCVAHEQPMQAASLGHDSMKQPVYGFNVSGSSFFPPSLESESMDDDTMKPLPSVTGATASSPSSHAMTYRDYTPDLLLHTSGRPQDLRLSLQSFHEPIFQDHHHHQSPDSTQQSFCSGTTNLAHGATSVACPVNKERMVWWNAANTGDVSGGEFVYNVALPPQPAALHLVNSQFHLYTQREPLQSSNLPPPRAWTNPTAFHPSLASAAADVFTSESYVGFSGFHIPPPIPGEEQNNRIVNNLHSASSASAE